jgi:hypothetical protein
MLTVKLGIQTRKHMAFVKQIEMRLRFRRNHIPFLGIVGVHLLTDEIMNINITDIDSPVSVYTRWCGRKKNHLY